MAQALPTCYLNGAYLPIEKAAVSPLDRAFLFGDAVYEVVPVHDGGPMLIEAHFARLARSLRELGIDDPLTSEEWLDVVRQLVERNDGGDLNVYLQVSRGADKGRNQVFPAGVTPTVFGMATPLAECDYTSGVSAITLPDDRWGRCDIKSTSLLANVLARDAADKAGAIDAILHRDGQVTEAAVSSVIIVEDGALVRRQNGPAILPGTTTDFVVELARADGIECREEPISLDRLRRADEIWLTGATKGIAPVVRLDDAPVGSGRPGPVWKRVEGLFRARIDG